MVNLCQNVKANEKGCRRYAVWEEEDTNGDPDIVLIEEYALHGPEIYCVYPMREDLAGLTDSAIDGAQRQT